MPLLNAGLARSGGAIKVGPEDFEVEEIPAYLPCGEGEHLYLWVEKRGRSTQEIARALAAHLALPERAVSYAGMKDKQAVTRQLFCVPAAVEPLAATFATAEAKVLWAKRHRNKLKSGHLRGNRFKIRLRKVSDPAAARASLERLQALGVPNYFGEQRFGLRDDNAEKGKRLLLGQKLHPKPDRFQRRLYLSAYQSLLFNRALAQRLEAGTFAQALSGDVLEKHDSGGQFVCEDPLVDQPRVDRFEVSPAGPIFGPKMLAAKGEVARAEAALLTAEQLVASDFARGGGETEGTRRPYRVPLGEVELSAEGEDLRLAFSLPSGSYATIVLRELTG